MEIESSAVRRNIEIKARLHDLPAAIAVAESLGGERQVDERQVDTYFGCATGRLKLRQINDQLALLIAYQRPDQTSTKGSNYILCPVADAELLRESLAATCGILGTVRKHRRIFLYRHVRIHLDEVEQLGNFLEFEAVLEKGMDEQASHQLLRDLQTRFHIEASDLLANSYGEMVLSEANR